MQLARPACVKARMVVPLVHSSFDGLRIGLKRGHARPLAVSIRHGGRVVLRQNPKPDNIVSFLPGVHVLYAARPRACTVRRSPPDYSNRREPDQPE